MRECPIEGEMQGAGEKGGRDRGQGVWEVKNRLLYHLHPDTIGI